MGAEQQQGRWYQPSLFGGLDDLRHYGRGEGGTGTAAGEERQAPTALERERALTSDLMRQVCERDNLNRAYKRVKANKGAPGVDGMTVNELYDWLAQHKEGLLASLLDGSYQPQAVRGVEIPKPGGSGKRQLGIPTVPRLAPRSGRESPGSAGPHTMPKPSSHTCPNGSSSRRGSPDSLHHCATSSSDGKNCTISR